jgi:adenosylmethionine-8-amino-7-oxononanoate aminotransferase
VSLASVRLLLSRGWEAEVAAIEAGLHGGLEPLRGHGAVADVRVLGAIGVVELREPVDMAASQRTLLDHGVWLRPFGRLLYAMPPFISSAEDVAAITAGMRAVVG